MKYTLLILILFWSYIAAAQKQNDNWCFGTQAGVNFSNSTPSVFTSTGNYREGGATVSDRHTGDLLFYTDGITIWDRTHSAMPNGNDIGTDTLFTSLQGAVICPHPLDSNLYYVFAHEQENSVNDAVYYSLVDMKLRNGLGDVVAGNKKIMLDTGFVEGMVVVPVCDGYWLLLASRSSNNFLAYRISGAGVSHTPVISSMTYPHIVKYISCIKISPDNKKILFSVYRTQPVVAPNLNFLSLHDFDDVTGMVSNGNYISLPAYTTDYYACEFSPDGSKAYVSDLPVGIYQFDLSLGTPAAIQASRTLIYQPTDIYGRGSIQQAPDGNLYVSAEDAPFIDRISNPNAPYPGCIYTPAAIALAPGSSARLSLPPKVVYPLLNSLDSSTTTSYLSTCAGKMLSLAGLPGAKKYLWQNNTTNSSFSITNTGSYWVRSEQICHIRTDTFHVAFTQMPLDIGNDTTICAGQTITLRSSIVNNTTTYQWSTGLTSSGLTVNQTGLYYLTVNDTGCIASDTVVVNVNNNALFELGNDTTLCAGLPYHLQAPPGMDSYNWNTGSTTNNIQVTTPGQYILVTSKDGCHHSDSIAISVLDGNFDLGNDTLLCYPDQYTIRVRSLPGSIYNWQPTGNSDSFKITAPGIYQVTVHNQCGIFTDRIKIDYQACDCHPFVPNAFTPNGDGYNDRIAPLLDCRITSYQFMIANRYGEIIFNSSIPGEKWDGTYKNMQCDIGTYYYLLKITNASGNAGITQKGDITLLR